MGKGHGGIPDYNLDDFMSDLTAHEQAQFKRDVYLRHMDKQDRMDELKYGETEKRITHVITSGISTVGGIATIVFGSKFAKPLIKTILH